MLTMIESLPLLRAMQGVGYSEDWVFSVSFVDGSGNPLSLAGITFEASVLLAGAPIASGIVGVVTGNILTITVLAANKVSWARGNYLVEILATDGTYTKEILTGSLLKIGAPAPLVITVVSGPSHGMAVPVSAELVAAAAAIAALQAPLAVVEVSASQAITQPGTYLVTAPGVTLALASAATIGGDVFIVDGTGSSTPAITATGAIGLTGSSAAITAAGGCLWLRPAPGIGVFILLSSGGGSGGGGSSNPAMGAGGLGIVSAGSEM